MNFTQYVEEQKKERRKNNILELRENINNLENQIKIQNHVENFKGLFTYEEVKEGILSNDIIASKFCKDPSKQNISEKLAALILKINKLPANGKNSIRFDDNGNLVHDAKNHTKSADFFYKGFYMTQKYTMEKGGAQDNQRNDVIDFLKRGSIKHKVGAIVDGEYWDIYRLQLKELFKDNPNVWITSISELTEGENK